RPGQYAAGLRVDRDAHPGRRYRLSRRDLGRTPRPALPAGARRRAQYLIKECDQLGKCSACQSASRFGLILPSITNTPGAPSATQALSEARSASVRTVAPRAPKPRAVAAKSVSGN